MPNWPLSAWTSMRRKAFAKVHMQKSFGSNLSLPWEVTFHDVIPTAAMAMVVIDHRHQTFSQYTCFTLRHYPSNINNYLPQILVLEYIQKLRYVKNYVMIRFQNKILLLRQEGLWALEICDIKIQSHYVRRLRQCAFCEFNYNYVTSKITS